MPPDVTALFYHGLREKPLPHVDSLYPCKDKGMFEEDLRTLCKRYVPVSHEQIRAAREGGKPLPRRAVAVSFDDGFAECFTVARPLLLKHGVPCTFFVISSMLDNRKLMHRNQIALCLAAIDQAGRDTGADLEAVRRVCGRTFPDRAALRQWATGLRYADRTAIDQLCEALGIDVAGFLESARPYMSTDQVRQLHSEGFTIGAHTEDHPEMSALSAEARRRQVIASSRFVSDLTGQPRIPFAIPFNGLDLARSELARLRDEAGCIDLIYDTNNLMRDRDFVVNRIWCDTPRGAGARHSNVPGLVQRARLYEPFRRIKRRLGGLPR
jgi:peptidoglycan/xylan/chitin deacetylase (PgdA/CDA1 family)